jgi:hypothetical protein
MRKHKIPSADHLTSTLESQSYNALGPCDLLLYRHVRSDREWFDAGPFST